MLPTARIAFCTPPTLVASEIPSYRCFPSIRVTSLYNNAEHEQIFTVLNQAHHPLTLIALTQRPGLSQVTLSQSLGP